MENTQAKQAENKVCFTCKQPKTQLLRCTRCRNVNYCGVDCQKKDWPTHKLSCSKINSNPPPPKQEDTQGMNEFYQVKQIGTGNFSTIYRVRSRKDEKVYAIKQAEKAKLQRTGKTADLFMQKHCLTKLKDCQYVVKLYRTFQDEINLYLQMQYPEKGQLWQYSKHFGVNCESIYKYYVCHLLKAVEALHQKYDIVHRDLKPENILLDSNYSIKLIDFGTARDLSRPDIKGAGNGMKGRKTFQHYVGTPHYMAPECIHNKASQKISDVYSLSGVLYFLKVGTPPFVAGSQYLIFTKSLKSELLLPTQLFDESLIDLIHQMNRKEKRERLPLQKLFEHQYFKGVDFEKLPSYEEALAKCTPFQKKINAICSELSAKYSNLYKESVEKRREVYNKQIVPNLNRIFQEQSQNKQQLSQKMEIIKLQVKLLINLEDDLNIGFSELYRKLKGIEEIKIELNEYDVQSESKIISEVRELKIQQTVQTK